MPYSTTARRRLAAALVLAAIALAVTRPLPAPAQEPAHRDPTPTRVPTADTRGAPTATPLPTATPAPPTATATATPEATATQAATATEEATATAEAAEAEDATAADAAASDDAATDDAASAEAPPEDAQPEAIYVYTVDDTFAAMSEHSALADCIVTAEVGGGWYGGPPFDPYSVGSAGELGVAQLHPRGLLNDFYSQGFSDPFSPYQSMDYLDLALDQGKGPNWTTYWRCT